MPIEVDPISLPDDPFGIYWTWTGIKEQVGAKNANAASDLDNDNDPADAVPDMDRVIADGTKADAYTNFRSRRGSKPYPDADRDEDGNIPSTFEDYELVKQATDTYAAYLLVKHRVWPNLTTPEDYDAGVKGLEGEYRRLYRELFGDVVGYGSDAVKPGTLQTVPLIFEPECDEDEFSSESE
jgi:hypothetical protein